MENININNNSKTPEEIFNWYIINNKATWWQMFLPSKKVIFGDTKTDMLGYKSEDFETYEDFTNLVHKDDYEKIMQDMRDHLEGKKDIYETTYKIKNSEGEYIRFYDCGQITKKENDEIELTGFVLKIENLENELSEIQKFKDLILEGKVSVLDIFKQLSE